jgi:hypothetical protein
LRKLAQHLMLLRAHPLERTMNRAQTFTSLACLATACLAGMSFSGQGAKDEVVSARAFRLLDSNGEVRAELSMAEDSDMVRLRLGLDDSENAALDLYASPSGTAGMFLTSERHGQVGRFAFDAESGTAVLIIKAGEESTSELQISCDETNGVRLAAVGTGESLVRISAGGNEPPSVMVHDPGRGVKMSASPEGSAVELLGEVGNQVLQLRGGDRSASLAIRGKDGKTVRLPE